jgi:RNA polymerase sigma factor (sigma-70 family)
MERHASRDPEAVPDRDTPPDRDTLTDELLAVRCQLGEAEAFGALIERWNGPLWGYLRRICDEPEDAADVLQDVWLSVLRGLPRLREPARLRPWLFGIARRKAMDRLRRSYADPTSEAVDPDALPAPEDDDAPVESLDQMHRQLEGMPLQEREVLVLFYLRELSLAQLAELLEVPVGTVKSRLFRARGILRRRMTDPGTNDE